MYHLRAVTFQFFVSFATSICQFVLNPQACTFFCFRGNIPQVPYVLSYEIDVGYLHMCRGHERSSFQLLKTPMEILVFTGVKFHLNTTRNFGDSLKISLNGSGNDRVGVLRF